MTDRAKLEYEIKTTRDEQFYVVLRAAGNRKILVVSESYSEKASAYHLIELLRTHSADGVIDDHTIKG